MDEATKYPRHCRRNIRTLMSRLCTDAQTAYAMILMTAALMDLSPDDDRVAETVLMDCGIESPMYA